MREDPEIDLRDRKVGVFSGDPEITGGGEDNPSAHTMAMQSRHSDGSHRLDGFCHEAPGVSSVTKNTGRRCRTVSGENAAKSAPAQNDRPGR